VRVGFV